MGIALAFWIPGDKTICTIMLRAVECVYRQNYILRLSPHFLDENIESQ